jgi:hypothetical protein
MRLRGVGAVGGKCRVGRNNDRGGRELGDRNLIRMSVGAVWPNVTTTSGRTPRKWKTMRSMTSRGRARSRCRSG